MKLRSALLVVGFLTGLFVIDRGLASAISLAFERVESGSQAGLVQYAIRQTDVDVVAFGSSRAALHVDPDVLERELGLTAFNAGAFRQGIRYARAVQAMLLDRGTRARIFVLHVDPRDLWGTDPRRMQRLAPFYGQNPTVDALLEDLSPTARIKLLLGTYRYNSLLAPILGNLLRDRPGPGNGFQRLPAGRPQDLRPTAEIVEPGPVLPDMSQLFVDFIEAGRARDVQVVLVDGPRWRPDGMRPMDVIAHEHFARLSREHGASYFQIDEVSEPAFQDPDYFHDRAHLTVDGAQLFSRRLAERLRPLVAR